MTNEDDYRFYDSMITKMALFSFIATVTSISIELTLTLLHINRHYAGIVKTYVVIPLFCLATICTIVVWVYYLFYRSRLQIKYPLYSLAPIMVWAYMIIKISLSI